MIIAQLRLLPVFLRLRFAPSFWGFTFSWAAVASAGMFWLGVTHRLSVVHRAKRCPGPTIIDRGDVVVLCKLSDLIGRVV